MDLPQLFPYDEIRPGQRSLVRHIVKSIGVKPMLAHAPTGLGKTVASLAPAIEVALEKDLTVFFLTSRHTQHMIALETIKAIKKKHGKEITALSVVGKQWMCLQPGVTALRSGEFGEFCRRLREDKQCNYYLNSRRSDGGATPQTTNAVTGLKVLSPLQSTAFMQEGEKKELCPYEVAMETAKYAHVVVCDYYYLFSPSIRERFLQRLKKELGRCIIIVDEGHNLPDRLRTLYSVHVSTAMFSAAHKEAEKYGFEDLMEPLKRFNGVLEELGKGMPEERTVTKGNFMKSVSNLGVYTDFITQFEQAGEVVQKEQKRSAMTNIANFLESWAGPDDGFARILSRKQGARGDTLQLNYKCLDPSILSGPVIQDSYWTLVMSGTLNPPEMYRDLLGFSVGSETQEYGSPFSSKNRLALVVPRTTTKFTARSEEQFKAIAKHINDVVVKVPGNVAVFFPSYGLRDNVYKYLQTECPRTMFLENPSLTKKDREDLLERFKGYKDSGAVLLGASAGSFGEGIDLPGDLLKGVIIVGLPLGRPDLETQELIKYYGDKFGQGWEYGYILPAFQKTLQNAGRCIRSQTDRGVIVFLDERYAWPRYLKCFPQDWDVQVTDRYSSLISDFFINKR
ncbi:MAG: ATP-dependent DNA helicase [Candidatus Nanoarchaeia archaeon]